MRKTSVLKRGRTAVRSTVIGRMTLRYSLRLWGLRSRLQMPQMKSASSR